MKLSTIVVRTVGGLALVGAGLLVARLTMGVIGDSGQKEVLIEIRMQNGVCGAYMNPETLGGKSQAPIRWQVRNVDCDTPQYVSMFSYREHLYPGLGSPEPPGAIVSPEPAGPTSAVPRGATLPADAKIIKKHYNLLKDKVYKYQICVGPTPNPTTNCLDPDVDVWPF